MSRYNISFELIMDIGKPCQVVQFRYSRDLCIVQGGVTVRC